MPTAPGGQADDPALERTLAELAPDSPQGAAQLQDFLARFPDSRWRLAIETDLGLWYYREGYFTRAIDAWEDAWKTGRALAAPSPEARALADRAVGELIRMHARLGHEARLKQLLAEVDGRPLTGPATEAVAGARQGLWMMDNDPGVAYLCGPNALRRIALLDKPANSADVKLLEGYRSGPQGVSLAEVGALARKAHVALKPAYRLGDAAVPVPSVVHWKVSHYAAIVGQDGQRYHLQDPTFGTDLWITRDALDKESSGYFLVPGKLPAGWREVTAAEADAVHGMGYTQAGDPNATRPDDPKTKPPCENGGMCAYNAHDMNVSLNIVDTPVGYTPAVGPSVKVTLVYNQREARQPAVPTFGNFGTKWTSNWLGYVVDVPGRPGVNVMSYVRGGGAYDEAGYAASTGRFLPEASNYSVLRLVSASPIQYERSFRDGSREVYATSDGAAAYPRRVFLTQVIDPQGNAATLAYDASKRLTTITDAVGRVTKFAYANASFPLQVTKITDPFGRFATITYDAVGRLQSIKDVLGLTSSMTYDSGAFITKLTTPYGSSTFAYSESGPDRTLDFTDPLGFTEHLESKQSAPGMPYSDPRGMPAGMDNDNQYLYYRNSFFWDKHAYSIAAGDYTKAKVQHWYHDLANFNDSSAAMASTQNPLEGRIWWRTPNDSGLVSGTYNQPRQIGRVLDDGTSQVTNIVYNRVGNVAAVTDPAGRTTRYDYAPNGIDILAIRQRSPSGAWITTAQYTYNAQHRPLTFTAASGQVTQYGYNAAGQLTSEVDALGHATSYEYDALGQLTRAVNANGNTAASYTYDGFGRIATRTDSAGHAVGYAYDAMDRPTVVTYPDATTEQYTYTALDLTAYKDRLNRSTTYAYDADRNLTAVKDPLQRTTAYGYYRNGALQTMTDPKGNVTTFVRDLQSRLTSKVFADGTAETYAWETYGGRLHARTDAAGRTQTYAWRVDNLPAGIAYSGGPVPAHGVSYAYDRTFPRVTSMTDGTGTTTYRYGAVGAPGALQLASEDGPYANDVIAYGYDALGRVTQRSVAGSAETFGYDSLGRLASDQSDLGNLAFGYLGDTGQVLNQAIGSTVGTSFGYESNTGDRRLKSIANLGARGY
ncbi:MAG TPA: RHS repeat protein, partial [Burkholderiaceae bacterium]